MHQPPIQGRTDRASLVVAVSPDTLYGAFADPAALIEWLPPGSMTGRVLEYDFREGGRYRIELAYGEDAPGTAGKTTARTDVSTGRFLTLDPGKRIVQSVEFETGDAAFAGEMIMTWTFEPLPTGTRVTITAENVPPGISQEDHDAGLRSSLENLARYLGSLDGSRIEKRRTDGSKDTRRAKQVLFVQGGGKDAHDSWDNKLVASLEQELGRGYAIRYPRMPDEGDPDPVAWKRVIARELELLGDGVILVGHSIGAAILLDYLADGDVQRRLAGVFLVAAPFIGDGGWPSGELRPTKNALHDLPGGAPLYLYQGGDDDTVPPSHLGMFERAVVSRAAIRRLDGRDHQLNDDLSEVARDVRRLR